MIERVRKTILEYGLIKRGDAVLAAFSGGADSTALMLILNDLKDELGFSLFAAHFDHGIRPSSNEDEEFCRRTAEELGVPFFSKREEVPAFAKAHSLSLETAARLRRYAFLAETAGKLGASIATAHHAGDSAESILMHIIRGSGMAGLAGIRPKTVLSLSENGLFFGESGAAPASERRECTLIRPLIGAEKGDILSFLEKKRRSFRVDETNFSADAARNFLRLEVMPAIEKNINPAAAANIRRFGDIAAEDEAFLSSLAEKALDEAREGEGFRAERLLKLPPPILKRCLRLALAEKATLVDIERVHIEKLTELLSMRSGQGLDLPHASARLSFGKLIIEPSGGSSGVSREETAVIPLENGDYETPFGRVSVRIDPDFSMEKTGGVEYNTKKPADRMGCMMDLDSLLALADGESAFFIRSRRAGDRFRPVNSDFRMKLKDFFISRKVDASKRDGIPLVVFGGEIVFIPGFLISDTVKLTGGTRSVLTLRFTE